MKELLAALKGLQSKEIEPNIVRQMLEAVDVHKLDYKEYVSSLKPDAFNRRMLMNDPIQVYLMAWAPQFFYPIHQHNNFWGFVFPLEGMLSETIYGYAPNKRKVYIHPTKVFKKGDLIYEPFNVIHKLQNASPIDSLVTLHVYFPPIYNFKDTTIFDAKNRTIAVLNDKATTISWDLPDDHYSFFQEEAYDLEKLW